MNFCKDCRWITWPWKNIRDSGGAICTHPSVMQPDVGPPNPVTGRPKAKTPGAFCDVRRQFDSDACGPDGNQWESIDQKPGFV